VVDTIPFYPYDDAAALVKTQIDLLNERADSTLDVANAAITELSNIQLPDDATPPEYRLDGVNNPSIVRPTSPATNLFGEVGTLEEPDLDTFQDLFGQLDMLAIPDYTPPITTLDIPNPPSPIDTGGAPSRPVPNDVTVPDDINPAIPGAPDELQINDIATPGINLPTFADIDVQFEGNEVNTVLSWAEPTYHSDTLDALRATILRWLAGGTGMTLEVEATLFDRARDKLDTTALQAEQNAFDTWASKGWAMPPGMLTEQVNVAQQQAAQGANDLAADILTKSAEWEQENMRQAVTQGIAEEGMLIQQFENVAKRIFDASKARLDADVQLFGQFVALYNAKQTGRQILVSIFDAKLKAALAPLDVMKAELEAEQLKGQINETRARVYATKMEAVKAIVSIFQARVEAAKAKSEVEKNKIDAFKADVEAFAAILTARKTAFDAYDSQMRGETAKGQIVEAYARAHAATVEGINGTNNAKINVVRARIEALGAGVNKYTAKLTAQRDIIGAQGEAVKARASSFSADVQRFSAEIGMNTELARLVQQLTELRLRNNLAFYEIKQKAYDAAMSRALQRTEIAEHGLAAAGGMAAQLAASTMAAGHVQASVSGSGSASSSGSVSTSFNHNFDDE